MYGDGGEVGREGEDWEKSSHISGWLYLNEFGIVLLQSRWPWR